MSATDSLAIEARDISKRFGDTIALAGVGFDVRLGEVHALVGQNGAGKSTLLKILQGVYQPDTGSVAILGTPVTEFDPHTHMDLGVSMIFQDFSLIPTLSATENIFLGRELRGSNGLTNRRTMAEQARQLFADIGIDVNPRTPVRDLSPGYQQLTEVAKAVAKEARILIMDEPTASLAQREVDRLFELIRTLRDRGVAIIYVSHRLDEIFDIADRITVLRDGEKILTTSTDNLNMEQLVDHIVGRQVAAFEWTPRDRPQANQPILVVEHLSAAGGPDDASFHIMPGEIVGIAGLMGSGRTSLARALMGLSEHTSGRIVVDGREVPLGDSVAAVQGGLALVPENRRTEGLVPIHSMRNNTALPVVEKYSRRGFMRDSQLTQDVAEMVKRLDIRPPRLSRRVSLLSGGNAQKVVIGKWLMTDSKVLILDEPTAGIDIGSKAEIIEVVRDLASAGMGVLVISSELSELAAMADRFLLMARGEIVAEFSHHELTSMVDHDAPEAERMAQVKQALELRVQQSSAGEKGS